VNVTLSLLRKKTSPGKVVSRLVRRYGLSQRQAYRYLQQAQQISAPLLVPESKAVFTVKLPLSLTTQVRQKASRSANGSRKLCARRSKRVKVMAEPKSQRKLRCEIHYLPDRQTGLLCFPQTLALDPAT